jgi:hypothetical protein
MSEPTRVVILGDGFAGGWSGTKAGGRTWMSWRLSMADSKMSPHAIASHLPSVNSA